MTRATEALVFGRLVAALGVLWLVTRGPGGCGLESWTVDGINVMRLESAPEAWRRRLARWALEPVLRGMTPRFSAGLFESRVCLLAVWGEPDSPEWERIAAGPGDGNPAWQRAWRLP